MSVFLQEVRGSCLVFVSFSYKNVCKFISSRRQEFSVLDVVFHLDPKDGENRKVQGGKSMRAIEGVGFWQRLCSYPVPN